MHDPAVFREDEALGAAARQTARADRCRRHISRSTPGCARARRETHREIRLAVAIVVGRDRRVACRSKRRQRSSSSRPGWRAGQSTWTSAAETRRCQWRRRRRSLRERDVSWCAKNECDGCRVIHTRQAHHPLARGGAVDRRVGLPVSVVSGRGDVLRRPQRDGRIAHEAAAGLEHSPAACNWRVECRSGLAVSIVIAGYGHVRRDAPDNRRRREPRL